MKSLLGVLALVPSLAFADVASISRDLKALRGLPEAERATKTGSLAHEIDALPAGRDRTGLALSLSHLATEGDAGHDSLQATADTLGRALIAFASEPKLYTDGIATLALLDRYEGMRVPEQLRVSRSYREAIAKLVADDRDVESADFTLKDSSGKSWSKSALRGKVVLLNFWATWCPPCRAELPALDAMVEKYGPQGLVVLAITDEDPAKVASFFSNKPPRSTVLFDPDRTVASNFHVKGLPHTYVFGRTGKLVAVGIDGRTEHQFKAMLEKAGLTRAPAPTTKKL